jgi:small-conductance mechanosensitive channel
MKRLLSIEYGLEGLAALLSLLAVMGVLHTFVIGQHFVIPTLILLMAVLFGNLARFGLNDQRWAKHLLFWVFLILAFHALVCIGLGRRGTARPAARRGLLSGIWWLRSRCRHTDSAVRKKKCAVRLIPELAIPEP